MKKLFFLFAFMGLFVFAANAQEASCASKKGASAKKACCASKKAASSQVSTDLLQKAADSDESIVKQVSTNGDVNYVRKSVCPASGKVSYTDVEYCTKSSKFVNVSPSDAKKSCTKKASATKVSSTAKKSCCSKDEMKACCKKGSKASSTGTQSGAKVKLVNDEGQ